ncbi:MAG: hypothetical protein JSR45_14050 [Proteobacteria bacterium]|nr:hypothetical protein [Pseudomonadota bacterium]
MAKRLTANGEEERKLEHFLRNASPLQLPPIGSSEARREFEAQLDRRFDAFSRITGLRATYLVGLAAHLGSAAQMQAFQLKRRDSGGENPSEIPWGLESLVAAIVAPVNGQVGPSSRTDTELAKVLVEHAKAWGWNLQASSARVYVNRFRQKQKDAGATYAAPPDVLERVEDLRWLDELAMSAERVDEKRRRDEAARRTRREPNLSPSSPL